MISTDAEFLNRVINDPSVYPFVNLGVDGPLDAGPLLQHPGTIFLANEYGGFLLIACGNGIYDVHTQFLPEGRGIIARKFARECLRHMFYGTHCVALRTFVATDNRQAAAMTLAMGFKRHHADSLNGVTGMVYVLTIDDWIKSDPELVKRGEWFHTQLEDSGVVTNHDKDDEHDRYAGLACEMALRGQVVKGAALYNMWCLESGYVPITVIRETPAIVDIQTALVKAVGGRIEVMSCQ